MQVCWSDDDRRIVHEAVVDASPEEVLKSWTTKLGLESWLAPHAEVKLKIGGSIRTNYDPNGQIGDPGTIVNTIIC